MTFLVQDIFEMYLWKCYQQGNSKITWFWHFAKLNERGQNKLKFIYSWKHWLVLWTKNKDSLYQKLWMEHKCGQISIQHTKVFIESFFCNMRSKEFLSAIIWKRKKKNVWKVELMLLNNKTNLSATNVLWTLQGCNWCF